MKSKRPVYLTRRATFCASHRLHAPQLSDAENKTIFDKCNHINGHGHNYILNVTLKGPSDPITGMIINLVDIKQTIDKEVIQKVDHYYLNLDVKPFDTVMPSIENMVLVFWDWLYPHLPSLYEIELIETENNKAFYRGE